MPVELPPCLATIIKDKNLLKKHYHSLLKFVNQYKPEALQHFLKHLLAEGISISMSMDIFEPFNCDDLKEFCSEKCPLTQDMFSYLESNTQDVIIASNGEDNTVLVVYMKDNNKIKLDLNAKDVAKSFISQIAYLYKRYIDLDFRRKADRQKWKEIMNFWLSKARHVKFSDIDEDGDYIRNIALDYLHSVPVRPETAWQGDYNSAVTKDGIHALFLKEALRLYISNKINKRISFKKLTTLLQPDVESTWVRVNKTRYAFYKFKMTEKQREEYEKFMKDMELSETDHEESDFDQDDWGVSDLFGGDV